MTTKHWQLVTGIVTAYAAHSTVEHLKTIRKFRNFIEEYDNLVEMHNVQVERGNYLHEMIMRSDIQVSEFDLIALNAIVEKLTPES